MSVDADSHGFEFTPFGPVPLGTGQQAFAMLDGERVTGNATQAEADAFERRLGNAVQRAAITVEGHAVADAPTAAPTNSKPFALLPAAPLTPRALVREARARIAAINLELRRMTALERERDELRRLVTAAQKKPAAVVPLHGRRTG